jgi:pyruvate/2-oxoglutarate dehydrogenase complex dihydrolipoamide dehydrogenase (E3) component
MTQPLRCDICVIGAGAAGLTVAAGAAQLGASTVLIERGKMGGDCLNYGCVPSKALLAAAKSAAACRAAGRFGIRVGEPEIDFAAAMRHVEGVVAAIAPNDSAARFEGLGARVVRETARFTAPDELLAGDLRLRARRFVIAAGAAPAVPPIPGLDGVPFLTNETLFANRRRPDHLLVIGGGPAGLEMAQAHARLGARVTVLEAGRALAKEDPELAELLLGQLRREGIDIREGVTVERAERAGEGIALVLAGTPERLLGSHLLVAAGRRPNVAALALGKAGIAHDEDGIIVDARLRTSNRRVYAIGDIVRGAPRFTHAAGYHAATVIRNALFRLPTKVDYRALPRVTYTDPELAHVGLTEAAARARHGDRIAILRSALHDNDRAQAERETAGLVKVVARRSGAILGASILAPHAGELIQPWVLALAEGLPVKAMASMIAPYPTLGEAGKRAAGGYYLAKLFTERTRRLVGLLAKFG